MEESPGSALERSEIIVEETNFHETKETFSDGNDYTGLTVNRDAVGNIDQLSHLTPTIYVSESGLGSKDKCHSLVEEQS